MRLHFINQSGQDDNQEIRAVKEVAPEVSIVLSEDGIPVYLERCEDGLQLSRNGHSFKLAYSDRTSLIRAVGLLAEQENADFSIREIPAFSMLGTMVDCSRKAVLSVESVKRLCRILALMGHNTLMLYTEDTYEIENRPYFGYMRGRYSAQELQECDAYASLLGIELVPCIQTLAHLNAALRWPEFSAIRDCDDILLAEDERTYQLIDEMMASLSKSLHSRRVHIGMDEAHMLGLGEYLRQHGYQNRSEIMLRHLKRVVGICKKYGYEPIMWSDMFFRLCNPDYYSPDTQIAESVIDMVPKEVTLTYWDYYHVDEKVYDSMIEKHQRFHNPLLFAGGAWSWMGLLPLNRFSLYSSRKALASLRSHQVKQVLVTAWGDNGGACPIYSVMPTLQLYAEACWSGNTSEEHLSRRLKACADMDMESFMELESPHFVPGRDPEDISFVNPARYLLFQDVLCGLFDRHVLPGSDAHFARCAESLEAYRRKNPRWEYLFNSAIALCRVMELKAEMGVRLKKAYDDGDRQTMDRIANQEIPLLLERLDKLHHCLYTQWITDYKIFGMDVQDIRLGGMRARIQRAALRINDYLEGRLSHIEELEVERLYFDGRGDDDGRNLQLCYQNWTGNVTASVL